MNKKKITNNGRRELYFPSDIRIRAREENEEKESRTIEGTAIVFNRESLPLYEDDELCIREVIAPEAVTRDLLDSGTILMTLYHDSRRLLARSLQGKGTLSYDVDSEGVKFRFDAPDTEDGRVALEAIKRGDITGCSFAFRANYGDRNEVERSSETKDGKEYVTYRIRRIRSVHDFTLTPLPAYPDTECSEARELYPDAFEHRDNDTEGVAGKAARAAEIERIMKIAENRY